MKQLLAVLAIMLIVESCPAGTWIPVIIHVHTIFSDGGGTPEQVAAAVIAALAKAGYSGKCVIIVCDHFDGVARRFDDYAAAIRAASNDNVMMIPGLELGSKWRPEPNTVAVSHLLAIGKLPANYRTLLDCYDLNTSGTGLPLLDRFDLQQQEINEVLALGMLPVAAHPTQLVFGGLVVRRDNRFNTKFGYIGLCAVEVMNNLGPGQDQECIDFIMRLIASGQIVFVTAGSDYHGLPASTIPEAILGSLDRVTWVYADDFSQEAVIRAIGEGKTYAAAGGSFFCGFYQDEGQNPGLLPVGVDEMKITALARLSSSDVKIIVYRDGIEVYHQDYSGDQSVCSLGGGDDFKTGWTDTSVQPGETHRYIVRVVGRTDTGSQTILITSPMTLRLRPTGESAAFFDAVKKSNITALKSVLAADPSLANARDPRGGYNFKVHSSNPLALSVACVLADLETVKLLLEAGADPEGRLTPGEAGPLMEIALTGDLQKAKLLLQYDADVNTRTSGNSPLIWAIGSDHSELAAYLISKGADVNLPGDSGVSPLKRAREHGMTAVINLLLAKGAKE